MSIKTAQTDSPIIDLLTERWSPRAYSEKLIEPEKVASLFEAARWSPSCFNDQPWHFIFAQKDTPEDYSRILKCLTESNQRWAKTAPLVGITVARADFRYNQKPNRHAWYDLGQAMAHLTVQAASDGLYVHQMAGFSRDRARMELNIPDGHDAVSAFTIGYIGDPDVLPEELKKSELSERSRLKTIEFLHKGVW